MKRTLVLLLTLLMISTTITAASAKVVTTYGDWTLEKYNADKEWKVESCASTDEEIVIPASYAGSDITFVSSYAFMNHSTLKSITAPTGCVGFGSYCFIDCTSLETVVLPGTVTVLDRGAFCGTSSLQSINLSDSHVSVISEELFMNSGITSIVIPTTCNAIGKNAFLQCSSLSRVEIPDNVNKIAQNAFNGCGQLVIACNYDSYAREYAVANGINYELLDAIEYSYVVGDTGGDGVIGIMDATIIQRMLVGLQDDPTGYLTLRGDAGSDGLSIYDATDIQRYLVGLPIESNVGERVTKVIYFND